VFNNSEISSALKKPKGLCQNEYHITLFVLAFTPPPLAAKLLKAIKAEHFKTFISSSSSHSQNSMTLLINILPTLWLGMAQEFELEQNFLIVRRPNTVWDYTRI
jgi:hypothetical protein